MATCDVCSGNTTFEDGTTFTKDEFRILLSNGFEPANSYVDMMAAIGTPKADAIKQWQQLSAQSETDWLLCSSCAARSKKSDLNSSDSKTFSTDPDGHAENPAKGAKSSQPVLEYDQKTMEEWAEKRKNGKTIYCISGGWYSGMTPVLVYLLFENILKYDGMNKWLRILMYVSISVPINYVLNLRTWNSREREYARYLAVGNQPGAGVRSE